MRWACMDPTPLPPQEEIDAVRQFIRDHWKDTVRRSDPADAADLPLPVSFVVPTAGPHFHRMYYWDTYFACHGLMADGHWRVVRDCGENFMHLLETQGFIPNVARRDCHRSQPPVASLLLRRVFEHTGDRVWLRRAVRALEKEHGFWVAMRQGHRRLAAWGHHEAPAGVENFYWAVRDRLRGIPDGAADRMEFLSHQLAEAESGSDFSPRFGGRCRDHLAVDLNALLYALERNVAWMHGVLGTGRPEEWEARAATRRSEMHRLLWDDADGFFYHFDEREGARRRVADDHALFALSCGVATTEQARRMVASLHRLECEHGIVAVEPGPRPAGQAYQWDAPNAWPPMQFVAIEGLLRYGYVAEARRVAAKVVRTVVAGFKATGNLWEKYNGVTGGVDVVDEYTMPPMLGWTAGTYVRALEVLHT